LARSQLQTQQIKGKCHLTGTAFRHAEAIEEGLLTGGRRAAARKRSTVDRTKGDTASAGQALHGL
jgi:hypothetical protein